MSTTQKLPNLALLAAKNRLPELVLAVLSHRISPKLNLNERDDAGCTALGYLAQTEGEKVVEAVSALLAQGGQADSIEPDLNNRSTYNPETGTYGHVKTHLALISLRRWRAIWEPIFEALGPSKLCEVAADYPLLHEAIERSNLKAVEALLRAGADPNREDSAAGWPLAKCTSAAIFATMVSSGARLGAADAKGRTVLQLISAGDSGAEILAMAAAATQAEAKGQTAVFKEGKAVVFDSKSNDDIVSPLIASLFDAIDAKRNERAEMLWKALNLGRNKTRLADARDSKGRSLLHAALSVHHMAFARRLMDRGLSLNVFSKNKQTPFTILLGLSENKRERDRDGSKRRQMTASMMNQVDWTARAEDGTTLFESLLLVTAETQNQTNVQEIWTKAFEGVGDWLAMDDKGESCPLSRVLGRAANLRYLSHGTLAHTQETQQPFADLLAQQMDRPEFGISQATAILRSLFGPAKEIQPALVSPPIWLAKIGPVIESRLERMKELGVDPESIGWSPAMAGSFPTLHAAAESWLLAGQSRALSAPRARARSL